MPLNCTERSRPELIVNMKDGLLISLMGLPGCGKTTIARALANYFNVAVYAEPEECDWPDAVKKRDRAGLLTAITWFRAVRVPMLYQAAEDRSRGKIAVIDSTYDILLSYYLGAPGMEWLMAKTDPYYKAMAQIAALDTRLLPNPDFLVFIVVKKMHWQGMLESRGRMLDRDVGIINTYKTQQLMAKASVRYCRKKGVR